MADDPYSRLYWRLSDEYPEVWDDPKVLGTYVQLLTAAEGAWPSHPHMLAYVEDDAVNTLTDCGLLVIKGKRFTIKGLDKERKKRSSHARKAASARYGQSSEQEASTALSNLVSTARSTAQTMPRLDETRRDEPSKDKTRRTARVDHEKKRGLAPIREMLT